MREGIQGTLERHQPLNQVRYSISLCSGIGGIDLALSAWFSPILMVERDPFRRSILSRRFPGAELETEVEGLDPALPAQLLTAGFPCQPFSSASRGRKTAKDLWPAVLAVIRRASPPLVFLENVQYAPIAQAASDIHSLGYQGSVAPLSASDVGAPHQRGRWWLLAHAHDARELLLPLHAEVASTPQVESSWGELPSGVLGVDDGVSDRVDRIKALGEAVVPRCAEVAFRGLLDQIYAASHTPPCRR